MATDELNWTVAGASIRDKAGRAIFDAIYGSDAERAENLALAANAGRMRAAIGELLYNRSGFGLACGDRVMLAEAVGDMKLADKLRQHEDDCDDPEHVHKRECCNCGATIKGGV